MKYVVFAVLVIMLPARVSQGSDGLPSYLNWIAEINPNGISEPTIEVPDKPKKIGKDQIKEWLNLYADKYKIPRNILRKLAWHESRYKPTAISNRGAVGVMQLMPDTAKVLGVDINDTRDNIKGGARFLRDMYKMFGTWELALAAYNAGPGRVKEYGGVPPFEETLTYIRNILGEQD
jgi:soluble lytic murein transglycosylase-like protein